MCNQTASLSTEVTVNMAVKENDDPDLHDFLPPRKKAKNATSPAGARFKVPTTDDEMAVIGKGYVPQNTQKNTAWAVRVFFEWRTERNKIASGDHCPEDLIDKPDVHKLNYWLLRFVTEVRKQDGLPYPPKTIHQILAVLQRRMLKNNPDALKFLDRSQTAFLELQRTCDTVYHDLHCQGIGATVRHTPMLSPDEESKLWSTGVLGCSTPKSLKRVVFFYFGKRFCIRGGEEQRQLGPSQFIRSEDPDCYTYTEHGSKNRSGGLAQLRMENKCVPCYAVQEKGPQCLVYLLDRYLSKLPQYAFKEDVLYCRPKPKPPSDERSPWYEPVAVGKNKLGSMVKEMCIEAGVSPKTNHSLHATGASTLVHSSVPEQIIQKTTGHRSLDGLHMYERVSTEQHQAVSRVMMSRKPTSFQDQLAELITSTQKQQCQVTSAGTCASSRQSLVSSGHGIGSLLDLTNCTTGKLTININPAVTVQHTIEEEFLIQ